MIINHNANALNAYNRLNSAGNVKSSAMEKLSSGMRINKSADDVAGSAISEEMKAQIRGLEQASRNVQDGISLIQTAEAGLGSIQNPNLQRMKELILQALNGHLTQQDRMKIQNELENVKASIDDIANDTEFNTVKLLSPPIKEPQSPPRNNQADIVFLIDNTGSMSGAQTTIANNIGTFINSIKGKGVDDVRLGVLEYTDEKYNPINFSTGIWSNSENDVENAIIELSKNNNGGTENAMTALENVVNNYDFRDNNGNNRVKHIIIVTNEDADDDIKTDSTLALLKTNGIQVHGVYFTNASDVGEFNKIINDTGGKSVNLGDSNWGDELSSIIGNSIGQGASESDQTDDKMPILELQVGANSGEEFQVELFDARTKKLGIDDVKVDPIEQAEKSLEKVEKAMELVSSQRSKFGSYQNALEHIAKNVDNYGYNISAAQSRISDVDMAKEVMEMTKSGIIEQSAQAMLQQAQKMPESVMRLMDKWKGDAEA